MDIRVASESDIPEMHRIRLAVRENRLLDPRLIQPANYRQMLSALGRGWVAEGDGEICGFAVVDLARCNVWALFVDPSQQGRGVGRALHDTMLHWLAERGVSEVWLSTEPGTRADRFYRTAGWRFTGIQRGEANFTMSLHEWQQRARR
jgi:GNAT superfamily N-acetyltransferase